ncbi:hypothetical protein N2152v2_000711 [Parachlorella kessleri]
MTSAGSGCGLVPSSSSGTDSEEALDSVAGVAVLLGQRVLEHVAVECAVYVGVRVLRAYTSEDSLLKLVKAAGPAMAVSAIAQIGCCWIVVEQSGDDSTVGGEENQQVQAGRDPIGHVPPLAAPVVELAAYGISQWLVHDVIGLWQAKLGDLEVVPLSGRIRQKLPRRTVQDLKLDALECVEAIVVEGLQGGALQVHKRVETGETATVRDAKRLAKEVYGPDVAILKDSHPSYNLLQGLLVESISTFFDMMEVRGSSSQGSVMVEALGVGPDRKVGVVVVDAQAPTGLLFGYTRRPAAQGGGRVVTSRVARANQGYAGGELLVGGVTRRLSVVLDRGAAYGRTKTEEQQQTIVGWLAHTAAHEVTHLMSRHTSETVHFLNQQGATRLVRLAADAFLRPAVRRATCAALGIQSLPAAGCSTPIVVSMLTTASLDLDMNILRRALALFREAPLLKLAQHGTSDIGCLARSLIHELEAEQGAMLLLARMGHSPDVMLSARSDATAYIIELGDGNFSKGLEKLRAMPASQLRISFEDVVIPWPDAPKVAWALAQVIFDAHAAYLHAVGTKQAGT